MVVPLSLCPGAARADTFILKDGTRHEGTAREDGDTLVITTYSGQEIRVPKNLVIGSTKEPDRNEYYSRAKALRPADASGHFALGQWAASHNLPEEAKAEYLAALQADPSHAGAGKALGYVLKQGRWAPPGEQGVSIGSAQAPRGDPRAEADEARRISARLAALSVQNESDYERTDEGRALVAQAREQPAALARVLKAPGLHGSANAKDPAVRAKAAQVLGLAGNRGALQPLLDACFEDPDEGVRRAAAKALPRLDEPISLRKLVDVAIAVQFPWPTRRLACAAIRRYGDPEAVERLLGEVSFELAGGNPRDPKNPLRSGPRGLGTEDPLGVADATPLSGPLDEHILYPALSALKEVTGVTFREGERDFKTWKEWWKANASSFRFKD
jgi:hypothetical protein